MKIRREFKVGIFAVIVILVSWWGIKWLQGQDLFKAYNTYTIRYESVSRDLKVSSRVYLLGVNVGNVSAIDLRSEGVFVEIAVENKYAALIPEDSEAMITEGLMGGAQIEIKQGESKQELPDGGEMTGALDKGLMGMVADKGTELIDGLNTTIESVNTILGDNSANITSLVANLESMSASIDALLSSGKIDGAVSDLQSFTATLAENTGRIESMISNLDTFTGDLAEADIIKQLNTTVTSLNEVLASIESGDGSIGMLLNDKQLYESLNTAGENLGALLEDLKANPMRYVHFSLFGKSEEQIAEKQAKREARAEKRAAKQAEK